MIDYRALQAIAPMGEVLDSKSVILVPRKGTPLEALVSMTRTGTEPYVDPKTGVVRHDIELMSKINCFEDSTTTLNEHTAAMDEILAAASTAVQKDLTVAQGVVLPAVECLVEHVAEHLNGIGPDQILSLEVDVWNPPKPLSTGSLDSILEDYQDVNYSTPSLSLNLPEKTFSEIREMCHVGNGGIDSDIDEFISTKGEDWLIDLYDKAFRQVPVDINVTPPTYADLVFHQRHGSENALIIFLIARRLFDNPIEGVSMSLDNWNKAMAEFRNLAGQKLLRDTVMLNGKIKAGIMVLWQDGRKITVYEPVYRDWLENGGSNEVLFGNMMGERGYLTTSELNASAAELLKLWERQLAMLRLTENSRKYQETIRALNNGFEKMIRDISDEERTAGANAEAMRRIFRQQCEQISESDLKDIYVTATKLLCRSRFASTNAESILIGINETMKACPNLLPREAAAMATIRYVTEWVMSQVEVVKR